MACVLTTDINNAAVCKVAGGSKRILITEFRNLATAPTLTANVITTEALATGKQFWEYNVDEGMISTTDNMTTNPLGGTYMYEPKVEISLINWSTTTVAELKLLAMNKVIVIVEGNDGIYRQFGTYRGLDVVTLTDESEASMNGFKGQKISFAGKETVHALEIDSSLITTLLAPAA